MLGVWEVQVGETTTAKTPIEDAKRFPVVIAKIITKRVVGKVSALWADSDLGWGVDLQIEIVDVVNIRFFACF